MKITEKLVDDLSESAADCYARTLNKDKKYFTDEEIKEDVYKKLKALLGLRAVRER